MSDEKNKDLESKIIDYNEYYKTVEEEYDKLLVEAKEYQKIIKDKIDVFKDKGPEVRGAQKILSDYFISAIQLLGNTESIVDKKFKLKSKIIDEQRKDKPKDGDDSSDILKKLEEMKDMMGITLKADEPDLTDTVYDDEKIELLLKDFNAEEKEAKQEIDDDIL